MYLKLINIAQEGVLNESWSKKLFDLLEQDRVLQKKIVNYSRKNLDLEGHLTFDALIDEQEEIVTCCGVYNGGRYPQGVYRILNRTYVAPKYRVGMKAYPAWASRYILPSQTLKFKSKMKFTFVSREGINGRHFLEQWIKHHAIGDDWKISNGFAYVAPKSNKKSAYQYIAYKKDSDINWDIKCIGLQEWKSLPE